MRRSSLTTPAATVGYRPGSGGSLVNMTAYTVAPNTWTYYWSTHTEGIMLSSGYGVLSTFVFNNSTTMSVVPFAYDSSYVIRSVGNSVSATSGQVYGSGTAGQVLLRRGDRLGLGVFGSVLPRVWQNEFGGSVQSAITRPGAPTVGTSLSGSTRHNSAALAFYGTAGS